MIAAGLGCRRGCASEDVIRAIDAALREAGRTLSDVAALYAPAFKAAEPALPHVAQQLGKPLVYVSEGELQQQAAFALTRSTRVAAQFGLPSIAETAALAGARAGDRSARLLGPRQVSGDATCALAETTAAEHGGKA